MWCCKSKRYFQHSEAARKAMQVDNKNARHSDFYVISFDMQQQSYVPQFAQSQMYYSKQLACINLSIHDFADLYQFLELFIFQVILFSKALFTF